MKYRVVEKHLRTGVSYQVQEQEPESKQWMDLLNEEDKVLEFTCLEDAKAFADYLHDIDNTLSENNDIVIYEV